MNAMLMKVRHRLLQTVWPSKLTWEDRFRPRWVVKGYGKFDAGPGTYWFGDASFTAWKTTDRVTVGGYCSIASEVVLLAGGNHPLHPISTYPFSLLDRWEEWSAESGTQTDQHLTIGNDVWIGARAMVVGNVTVGDGAVIGAGAVVVRDVPPYAVVAGVPAKVVRQRFSDEDVATLLELKWWSWPQEDILAAEPVLRTGDVPALASFAHERGLPKADTLMAAVPVSQTADGAEATLESGA